MSDDLITQLRSLSACDPDCWGRCMACPEVVARDAADEIERLRAPSQWQPIETAPRDGTRILVAAGNEQFVAFWGVSIEEGDGQWVICRRNGSEPVAFIVRATTRWQPLPPPPAAPEGE